MKARRLPKGRRLAAASLATVAIAAAAAVPVAAQRVTLHAYGGAAVGNYSESAAGLELTPGLSIGAMAELGIVQAVGISVYAGLTRGTFNCEEGFCAGNPTELTSQGLVAGLRWSPGPVWARGGVAFATLDISPEGGASGTTDRGVGFDLGVGLNFDLGPSLQLRPGVGYRRHAASLEGDDGTLALITGDVGLAFSF